MKKLRDIIYDYNDVVVALLIVIAAGLVIFWRVGTVMAYPKYVSENAGTSPGVQVDFNDVDLNPDPVDPQVTPGVDPTEATGSAIEPATGSAIEDPKPTGSAVEPPKSVTKTLTISRENKNGSWQAVGDWLLDNGFITNKAMFIARVTERGVDKKLRQGTFEFMTGMTLDEVIDILIK